MRTVVEATHGTSGTPTTTSRFIAQYHRLQSSLLSSESVFLRFLLPPSFSLFLSLSPLSPQLTLPSRYPLFSFFVSRLHEEFKIVDRSTSIHLIETPLRLTSHLLCTSSHTQFHTVHSPPSSIGYILRSDAERVQTDSPDPTVTRVPVAQIWVALGGTVVRYLPIQTRKCALLLRFR